MAPDIQNNDPRREVNRGETTRVYQSAAPDERTTRGYRESPYIESDTRSVRMLDRVRWGPVIAGMFAALSVAVLLSVLGLAVGFSSVDPGDSASAFGIGAGIWGGVTALMAFLFGGWIAARTSATVGERNGLLQGAMVWMVTVPLLLYFVAGGVGTAFRTAGSIGATGAQGAASQLGEGQSQGQNLGEQASQAAQQAGEAASRAMETLRQQVTPQGVERTAEFAGTAAWGALLSLLLGLGASALGGY